MLRHYLSFSGYELIHYCMPHDVNHFSCFKKLHLIFTFLYFHILIIQILIQKQKETRIEIHGKIILTTDKIPSEFHN